MRWRLAAISCAPTDPHRRESILGCLAAVAAGDIRVGPDSGPVHVAAAAGKPSVVIYGGDIHPDCVAYPGNVNLFTALPCSPCWLLIETCPYDRVCLTRISPERVEEAIASLARVGTWKAHRPLEQMRVGTRAARSCHHGEWRTSRRGRLPRRIRG